MPADMAQPLLSSTTQCDDSHSATRAFREKEILQYARYIDKTKIAKNILNIFEFESLDTIQEIHRCWPQPLVKR